MLASIAILMLFGIFLLILETFLPGWVAGILGTVSILIAVSLALYSDDLAGWSFAQRSLLVAAMLIIAGGIMFAWLRWFAVKFFKSTFTLSATVAHPIHDNLPLGQQGVALTDLRPLGRAEISGHRYEVRCQSGIARAGALVEVIAAEPGNLLVRAL